MSEAAFYLLSALTVAAAAGVLVLRNPVHCAMSLVLAMFLIAILYVALQAHLVAALQIIVYAGAILVLFLFVIMLLNLEHEPVQSRRRNFVLASVLASVVLAAALLRSLFAAGSTLPGPGLQTAVAEGYGTSAVLAERLFTHFVLPFEITSILLLVAVLGAVVLAKRRLH